MILLIFLYSFLMVCSGEVYDPLSRCVPGVNTYVCGNCYNQMACVDVSIPGTPIPRGTLSLCPPGTFCDMRFDGEDGNCLSFSNPGFSPECLCENEGCFVDPNNEASHISCGPASGHNSGTIVAPCDPGDLFDGIDCGCSAIECPSCEFLPAGHVVVDDVDECSIEEFYYCGEDEVGSAFKCNVADDYCFDERTCRCEKKPGVVDFPKCLLENCGFILYEGDATGAGYVSCTDYSINYCPTNQTYNETMCLCQGGFDCPVPAKPDIANCTGAPCLFIPDPANPTGGFINCADETFSACPSDQLFNDTTCLCYSEAETEVPVVCPADNCGYIPYPDNTGTWYINCNDSSISVCPLGQNFNESVCLCMGGTECPGPVTENVPECSDTTINTCGFVEAPDTEGMGFVDCSDFSVSKCPTDQLFNATNCQCYSLNATCSSGGGGETCIEGCDFYPEAGENACPGYRDCVNGYPADDVFYCPAITPCFDVNNCACVGEGAEEGGPVVSLKNN